MDAMQLDLTQLAPAYLPVLCRVGAMLAIAPPFASPAVPRRVRALLAMGLTIGLLPAVAQRDAATMSSTGQWVLALGGEMLIGLAMGLALAMVFAAVSIAGDLVAAQLGLSLPQAYDPRTADGAQGTVMAQAFWLIAAVVFFAVNGHHAMLRGLSASFAAVPAMTGLQAAATTGLLVGLLQSATALAIQIAAPVFVATLVADLAMGMVARTIPQLGVMTAGLTVRAIAGMVAAIAAIAGTVALLRSSMTVNWTELTRSMFGG